MKIMLLPIAMLCMSLFSCDSKDTALQNNDQNNDQNKQPEQQINSETSQNNGQLPEATFMFKDVVYKTVNNQQLMLDVYLPDQEATNVPLIVWIHGGAWKRGDKEAFVTKNNHLLNSLLNEGYAVASLNYRLTGEAIFPAQIQDCNDAINFLYDHFSEYKIDREKITMMGRSAGGHLAGLVTASASHQVSEFFTTADHAKFKVTSLVSFFGPSDLLTLVDGGNSSPEAPESKLLGGVPANVKDIAQKASPVTYVNATTPPAILMHGTNDRTVLPTQSVELNDALSQAGVYSELYLAEGARHGDPVFDTEEYVGKVLTFLREKMPAK